MYVSTFSFLTRLSKPRQKSLHKSDYQTFPHYSRSQISKGNQQNTLITLPFPFFFKGRCTSENVQCVHGSALTLMASLFHSFLSEFQMGPGHAPVKQDESPPEITSIHKGSLPALSNTSLQLL